MRPTKDSYNLRFESLADNFLFFGDGFARALCLGFDGFLAAHFGLGVAIYQAAIRAPSCVDPHLGKSPNGLGNNR
jgi:hypothetical protein